MGVRDEFEAWALDRSWSIAGINGFYDDPRTHDAWSAWQASRAALVVQVPDSDFAESWMDAIEAVGVKVKI